MKKLITLYNWVIENKDLSIIFVLFLFFVLPTHEEIKMFIHYSWVIIMIEAYKLQAYLKL